MVFLFRNKPTLENMERFALKVDLSEISEDVLYQKIMILVDPNWSDVAEVKNKIKNMLNIKTRIGFKSAEGFFIPLEEPVEILRYVSMLVAFKCKKLHKNETSLTEKKQSRNSQPEILEPEILTTSEYASKQKRKYGFLNEENFTTSTPNPVNAAKRLKSASPNQEEAEYIKLSEKRKKKKSKTCSPDKDLQAISGQAASENSEHNVCSNLQKSKTKTNSYSIPVIENSKSEKHIFFDSERIDESKTYFETEEKQDDEEPRKSKNEIIFVCELTDSETSGRGRSFQIKKHANKTENTKNNSEIQNITENYPKHVSIIENLTICQSAKENPNAITDSLENNMSSLEESTKPPNESLISCDESAVIDLNESEQHESQSKVNLTADLEAYRSTASKFNDSRTNESSFVGDSEISKKAISLTDLPSLNDQIIFKVALSNNKMSDDLVGICEYVNKRTKSIKLRLINGHSQLHYLPQKLVANLDDSNGLTILNVKLQEMYGPKVLTA